MKKMKLLFTFLLVLISTTLFGCSDNKKTEKRETKYDNYIVLCIGEMKSVFEEHLKGFDGECGDKLIIKNTRVVVIDENTTVEEFKSVKYVVEFVVYCDYYGSNGKYYTNPYIYDTYTIYKNNNIKCENIIRKYANSTYDFSYSYIKEVVEFDSFNQTITLNLSNNNA